MGCSHACSRGIVPPKCLKSNSLAVIFRVERSAGAERSAQATRGSVGSASPRLRTVDISWLWRAATLDAMGKGRLQGGGTY